VLNDLPYNMPSLATLDISS